MCKGTRVFCGISTILCCGQTQFRRKNISYSKKKLIEIIWCSNRLYYFQILVAVIYFEKIKYLNKITCMHLNFQKFWRTLLTLLSILSSSNITLFLRNVGLGLALQFLKFISFQVGNIFLRVSQFWQFLASFKDYRKRALSVSFRMN